MLEIIDLATYGHYIHGWKHHIEASHFIPLLYTTFDFYISVKDKLI
jgi:hypothetical protein